MCSIDMCCHKTGSAIINILYNIEHVPWEIVTKLGLLFLNYVCC